MPDLKCPECGATDKFWRAGYCWLKERRVNIAGKRIRQKYQMYQCTKCGRKFNSGIKIES